MNRDGKFCGSTLKRCTQPAARTPQEFAQHFGIAQQDVATVQRWLEAEGFTVNGVTPSGMTIDFSVLRLEIPYGRMRRSIELPPGRYLLAERRLDGGCLFLKLKGFAT